MGKESRWDLLCRDGKLGSLPVRLSLKAPETARGLG